MFLHCNYETINAGLISHYLVIKSFNEYLYRPSLIALVLLRCLLILIIWPWGWNPPLACKIFPVVLFRHFFLPPEIRGPKSGTEFNMALVPCFENNSLDDFQSILTLTWLRVSVLTDWNYWRWKFHLPCQGQSWWNLNDFITEGLNKM